MDCGSVYIKMSDKEDIQALANLLSLESKQGSTFVKADDCNVIIWAANVITAPPSIRFIRLFHQDQLQEMVSQHNLWLKTLAFEFFLRKEGKYDINGYPYQFTSLEQLWLAFVMKEKYNKIWTGQEWEKIEVTREEVR